MPVAGCRPVQFTGGVLSAYLTFSGLDVAGSKSDWGEGDEAADAPTSLVLSSLLGAHADSMIALSNKRSDDVSLFIVFFPVLKGPSEYLPFHFQTTSC